MQRIKIRLGISILALLVMGAIFIIANSKNAPVTNPDTNSGDRTYSMSEVSSHKNAQSCWTAIGGNVYDLTSWINGHPGGKLAILSLCGTDGTEAFNAQHGGQARPETELKSLLIGKLE